MITRRRLSQIVGLSGLLGLTSKVSAADTVRERKEPPMADTGRPFHIGMIIYDGMTTLDFAGPADVLSRPPMAKVFVLAKSLDPVVTDTRGRILPDLALRDAPELDMLFIGGGIGVAPVMEDKEILDFLREREPSAKWVTSVCTGALVLGAAGLLRGYKATTHWTSMDILATLGAEPVNQRVVIDRNRITGGGVTAGIDFGLIVANQLWGLETAQLLQLGAEYDPQPPFNSGSPSTAPSAVVERFRKIMAKSVADRQAAATRIASKFN
jgi:cyclohexyl-isocyanide hydratase